jgi:acetyl esterase/lipase
MPFNKQFEEKTTGLMKIQFLAKTLSPFFKSTGAVIANGVKQPDWTPGYSIAVQGMKGVLEEISKEPNVALVQELSSKATPVPRKAKLTEDHIKTKQSVIEFLRNSVEFESENATEIACIPGEWIDTNSPHPDYRNRIVYELHGGAYCVGSAGMYRRIHYLISKKAHCRVFGLNYRLAPQNPFPSAVIDAASGYLELKERYPDSKVALMGDSAGGGLVMATLLCLRDMKNEGTQLDMPVAAFCMSPCVDLTHSFPSFQSTTYDYLPLQVVDSRLGDRKHYYTSNENLKHPYVSPLFANSFEGIPPVLMTAGKVEKLFDEIDELSKKLPIARFEIYQSHIHVFQAFPIAEAAALSFDRAAEFFSQSFEGTPIDSRRIEYNFKGVEISSELS